MARQRNRVRRSTRPVDAPSVPKPVKEAESLPQQAERKNWAGLRRFLNPRVVLLGVAVLLVVILGIWCFAVPPGGSDPVPVPTPTPEPTMTPTPSPTPIPPTPTPYPTPEPFRSVIPGHLEQFTEYRFYNFLFEYQACFGLPDERGRYLPTKETESEVLHAIHASVVHLLDAYDNGDCIEQPVWRGMADRGGWLRYWGR